MEPSGVIQTFLRLATPLGIGAVFWNLSNRIHYPQDGFFSNLSSVSLMRAGEAVSSVQLIYFLLLAYVLGEFFIFLGRIIRRHLFERHQGHNRLISTIRVNSRLITTKYLEYEHRMTVFDGISMAALAYLLNITALLGQKTMTELSGLGVTALGVSVISMMMSLRMGQEFDELMAELEESRS